MPLEKLCPEVKKIYEENTVLFENIYFDGDNNERRFYVYEWFTKDTGKIFYIGKGTGSRYNHIRWELDKDKGKYYKMLSESFGIESRFVLKGLTDLEAQIYEYYLIHKRNQEGEALIQFVDNNNGFWRGHQDMIALLDERITPQIYVRPFFSRYFGVDVINYDTPNEASVLFTHFVCTHNSGQLNFNIEIEKVKKYIEEKGGKVFASAAKSARSIIDCHITTYEWYLRYKEKNYQIFHLFDVLAYFNKK